MTVSQGSCSHGRNGHPDSAHCRLTVVDIVQALRRQAYNCQAPCTSLPESCMPGVISRPGILVACLLGPAANVAVRPMVADSVLAPGTQSPW